MTILPERSFKREKGLDRLGRDEQVVVVVVVKDREKEEANGGGEGEGGECGGAQGKQNEDGVGGTGKREANEVVERGG